MDSTEVIDFWFNELGVKDWFRKDEVLKNFSRFLNTGR
jgi:uncharacterized protein (DUF924 family)